MAQIREVRLVDDIDGSAADETVDFGLDGRSYEIDLASDKAAKLRDALAPYLAAARRASGGARQGPSRSTGATSAADRERSQQVRAWLRENGYKVSDRGRIGQALLDAYESSTPANGAAEKPEAEESQAEEKPKRSRSRAG